MKQNNFNFLRFYFAFIVVVGHLIGISKVGIFQPYLKYFNTYISVTAFFCISGFLITNSYLNTSSLKNYLKKRAARLLPAYIFVVIISSLFLSLLSRYSFADYFTHPQLFKYLGANLSFLNFIQPCLPGVFLRDGLSCDVNGALWTLKIEVSFYLTIPILLYVISKVRRKYILLIAIYLLSVLYKYSLEHLSEITGNGLYLMLSRQLPGFLSYFACGIALYYYQEFFLRNKKWLLILGFLVYVFEVKMGLEILTPVALSIIIFTFAFSFEKLNSFAKHGDISYGIYIYHCGIIKVAVDLGFFEKYNPIIVALAIIILVILAGFTSWHLLEKRFLKKTHSIRIE
ncbi:MAG: acyltransferase [Paludibacter sp.]